MIILLSIVVLCSIILLFLSILPFLMQRIQACQQKQEHLPSTCEVKKS